MRANKEEENFMQRYAEKKLITAQFYFEKRGR